MPALCKADLVGAVLKQLGYDLPNPETLTKAVFEASATLKREVGIAGGDGVCLLLTPISAEAYAGGVRDKTDRPGGVKL